MIVQLQVALFTNLIVQHHLLIQATYGLRILLGKSPGQEASLQDTAMTFAWDVRMKGLRQRWITASTSWPRLTAALEQSIMA